MANKSKDVESVQPSLWRRIRSIHPGLVLATLDLIGLGIASYLSIEELQNHPLICAKGGIFDCNAVAQSTYSRPFAGIPVAVYGVFLSLTLFALAIAWWRTNNYKLLLLHYGISLVGVLSRAGSNSPDRPHQEGLHLVRVLRDLADSQVRRSPVGLSSDAEPRCGVR